MKSIKNLILLITMILLGGCQFFSAKQYQCWGDEYWEMRGKVGVSVYKGMTQDKFLSKFESDSIDFVTLERSKENKFFIKYKECPLWRYEFNDDVLIEAAALYFEGYWFYNPISLTDAPKS